MSFYDFIAGIDVRSTLFEPMLRKFGLATQLKSLPDHAGVSARAVDRCRACGHQDDCAEWLGANDNPPEPPVYCRNRDLIARLSKQVGLPRPS